MLVTGFISFYLAGLSQFAFVSHPIVYCFLLLCCSLSAAVVGYITLGFSWYIALFCLVYIGGVYILFIFVSIHNPNSSPVIGSNIWVVFFFWVFYMIILSGLDVFDNCLVESSHLLCSWFEGFTYCIYCFILLIGFSIISIVSSDKSSFYR